MIYGLLIGFLVIVGLLMGYLAGVIWKQERPLGMNGDLGIGVLVTLLIGFLDWFLIPALGFSNDLKYLAVAIEPAIGALIVLWIIRKRAQR
ncbi:MAG: GlsB/YeaQ/YmgE family stress response membrane protein [Anaerolineaceae bacterium]|nr:GlsB/YeaQ/YmgE family stress response membrane protein [Anaerolineaceae bacterium]